MRRYVPVVLITAGILLFGLTVASALVLPPPDPVAIEAELEALVEKHAELVEEHDALVEWVADELEPWTEEVEEAVEPSPGPPSPANLPSLPPVPSVVPTPEPPLVPTPTPSVDLGPSVVPTPEPSPSVCLPIICVEGSPSP